MSFQFHGVLSMTTVGDNHKHSVLAEAVGSRAFVFRQLVIAISKLSVNTDYLKMMDDTRSISTYEFTIEINRS